MSSVTFSTGVDVSVTCDAGASENSGTSVAEVGACNSVSVVVASDGFVAGVVMFRCTR